MNQPRKSRRRRRGSAAPVQTELQREVASLRAQVAQELGDKSHVSGINLQIGDIDEEYVPDLKTISSRMRIFDRMANDPGPWFNRKTADPEDVKVMDTLVQRITVVQLDPADVVKRYVELVEADKTELVNFIPPDIVERMSKSMPAR